MPASLPCLVLVLALLLGAPAAAQPAPAPGAAPGARHIVLRANAPGEQYEVRIAQGITTTLLFDPPLQPEGLLLEKSEFFRWALGRGGDMLTLLPRGGVKPGQRLTLKVRFADGQAPASVDLLLVVVEPVQAERQVEVYRPPSVCAPYRLEAEEERARAFQFQLQLAQVLMAQRMALDGLVGLLAFEQMDREGVRAKRLRPKMDFTQSAEEVVEAQRVTSYRSRSRVAAEVWLKNRGAQPWLAKDAELVGPGGMRLKVLRVWQPEPIPPGTHEHRVVVEAEATEAELRGPFRLHLREENGSRNVTLEGVTFP